MEMGSIRLQIKGFHQDHEQQTYGQRIQMKENGIELVEKKF